ncbi:MAG: MFS transporter [Chloroflexi bacterium]|nr:MFS transporter [Chloroflexota bacterium]
MPSTEPSTISKRNWTIMAALAITGQIAWAVENTWFNNFVYDTITPDPRPVAWMVAASALVATLTTILMGTLSDRTRSRMGRRKPYILFGYIFWGLMTIAFPMTAWVKNLSWAVVMVVLVDCVMTFFGSTANDAAFNAWTADITPNSQRGKVEGVLNLCLFIAQLTSIVAAGILIDNLGYFSFFYLLGGIVMVVGLTAGYAIKEVPLSESQALKLPFWQEIRATFDFKTILANKILFLILASALLLGIGFQVSFPYMIIYINHTIGVTKTQYSLIGGVVIIGSALLAVPLGNLADRVNRKVMLAVSVVITSLGCFMFSLVESLPLLALAGLLWQAANMTAGIVANSWVKELLPVESRGRFLGVRMIFLVLLPMLIGPRIGSSLIQAFGSPTVLDGKPGFLPVALIFKVGALLGLLGLIPLPFIKKNLFATMEANDRPQN